MFFFPQLLVTQIEFKLSLEEAVAAQIKHPLY